MDVRELVSGDRAELGRRTRAEKHAKQRDRYRAAAMAIDGREAEAIAAVLDRSRRFVQRWAYAYRVGGIDAIAVKKQKGPKVRLTLDEQERLARRLEAGPLPGDGVCTLRGLDVVEILRKEFEKSYSLNGVYDLLHRLGFSSPRPRPRHRKNDPAAMEAFKASAPFLSMPCVHATPIRGRSLVPDEARVGQQGTLTRMWARTGTRPRMVRQTEYKWVYIYGAVNVSTGESCGLRVPANITLHTLPPYSPELNPVELVWLWLREHVLSNRVFATQEELDQAASDAWNSVDAERFTTKPAQRATWGKVGVTPVVKIAGRGWKKISAVGVLTLSPGRTKSDGTVVRRRVGQHFKLYEGDIDGERCAACLCDLLRRVRGKVVLLWDGLAVHRSPPVKAVLARHPRVTVHRLPGYAPELNPVEPMWAHAKGSGLRGYVPDDEVDLEIEAACTLEDIGKRQALLRSFFQATPLHVPGVT